MTKLIRNGSNTLLSRRKSRYKTVMTSIVIILRTTHFRSRIDGELEVFSGIKLLLCIIVIFDCLLLFGSFVTVSQVNTVMGKFARLDSHSNPEKELLDSGATE